MVPDSFASHPRIEQMHKVLREQMDGFQVERARDVARLTESVKAYAYHMSEQLTRSDRIEEALAWRHWGDGLAEHEAVKTAAVLLERENVAMDSSEEAEPEKKEYPPALSGRPATLTKTPVNEFAPRPKVYLKGNEPTGDDKPLGRGSIPNAKGAGNGLINSRIILVEEDETLNFSHTWSGSSRHKSHLYVARLEFAPIANKPLGRTLVVFDLFKRGSGSKREVIRTEKILLPPIKPQTKVVVDAGAYAYETRKYRSHYSNYRYKNATADEFYGYIVSMFDETGELVFQRSTDRMLDEHARERPPK